MADMTTADAGTERMERDRKKRGRSKTKKPGYPRKKARQDVSNLEAAKLPEDPAKKLGCELLIDCSYANELPQPPVPKLLRALPGPESFFRYRPTSLELDHRPYLLSEDDIVTRVDLVDPNAYGPSFVEDANRAVNPLEKVVLADDDLDEEALETNQKKLEMYEPEMQKREAIILRRHILTSNDVYTDRQVFVTGGDAAEKKLHRECMLPLEVVDIADRVERTFEQAKKAPVHPTNPQLKVKRVLPVLPDFELWNRTIQQVSFDEPPDVIEEGDLLFKTVPNPRTTCFAYFTKLSDGAEGQYRMMRNFIWDNRGQYTKSVASGSEQLLLSFPGEESSSKEVKFLPIATKMQMNKQKAKRLDIEPDIQELHVSFREPSARESEEDQARLAPVEREDAQVEGKADKLSLEFVNGDWRSSSDRDPVLGRRESGPPALPLADSAAPAVRTQLEEEEDELFGPDD